MYAISTQHDAVLTEVRTKSHLTKMNFELHFGILLQLWKINEFVSNMLRIWVPKGIQKDSRGLNLGLEGLEGLVVT